MPEQHKCRCSCCQRMAPQLLDASAVGAIEGDRVCQHCFEVLEAETSAQELPLLYDLVENPKPTAVLLNQYP